MDAQKLMEALNGIDDRFILEADLFQPVPIQRESPARRIVSWAAALAACAAVLTGLVFMARYGLLDPIDTEAPPRKYSDSFPELEIVLTSPALPEETVSEEDGPSDLISLQLEQTLADSLLAAAVTPEGDPVTERFRLSGSLVWDGSGAVQLLILEGTEKSPGQGRSFCLALRPGGLPSLASARVLQAASCPFDSRFHSALLGGGEQLAEGVSVRTGRCVISGTLAGFPTSSGGNRFLAECLRPGTDPLGVDAAVDSPDSRTDGSARELCLALVGSLLAPGDLPELSRFEKAALTGEQARAAVREPSEDALYPDRSEELLSLSGSAFLTKPLSPETAASLWDRELLSGSDLINGETAEVSAEGYFDPVTRLCRAVLLRVSVSVPGETEPAAMTVLISRYPLTHFPYYDNGPGTVFSAVGLCGSVETLSFRTEGNSAAQYWAKFSDGSGCLLVCARGNGSPASGGAAEELLVSFLQENCGRKEGSRALWELVCGETETP